MIRIDNLKKSFGGRELFDGISFTVNAKERVGLVGRNGHGKTTLFRLIVGETSPDDGAIDIPKNYRVGYVQQQLDFTAPTVLEEGRRGLPPGEEDHFWKVERILMGLGFSAADMQRPPAEFSGGFQVRLNLAKTLLAEPDLLLLDEPTNYLDITSIRWIERFLKNWPRELMLISHDRSLMDKLVTHVVGLHRRQVRKVQGDTAKYYDQIALEEEIHEKTRLNDERRRKEIEQFITRFRAKARLANLVQSRIKTLSKLTPESKLDKIKALDFAFTNHPFKAKYILTLKNLSFGYTPDQSLIENLNISIGARDRIGVVGPNGKGKTTLLKLLAGALTPSGGRVAYHAEARPGYFEQTNVSDLVDSRTVEEEIGYANPGLGRTQVRNICGAMLFEGDNALKKVGVLSGGEKSRVMLGKLLATPANMLLLDEPTNHLDMEACDALLAAIDSFEGTVVMVTHNELFLHALSQRLIVFQEGDVTVFEGGYRRFLDDGGWRNEQSESKQAPERKPPGQVNRKALRRQRSALLARKALKLNPLRTQISAIEQRIETNEAALKELSEAMLAASQEQDGNRIAELGQSMHNCQAEIDRLFTELEQVSDQYDRLRDEFDHRVAQLGTD
jgi:ATP-binding cassette subfamily F protein 3